MHRYIRVSISLFHYWKLQNKEGNMPPNSSGLAFEELRHVYILRRLIENKNVTF